MSALQAIRYEHGSLSVLDQLLLPHTSEYVRVANAQDGFSVIRNMQVRGAPAIALVAALAVAVDLQTMDLDAQTAEGLRTHISQSWALLRTSRPTAVNLFDAAADVEALLANAPADASPADLVERYVAFAERLLREDVQTNRNIGHHGLEFLRTARAESLTTGGLTLLTHCNTGSLATAGYGTALGIIRAAHEAGCLKEALFTETRPYNQGSRLTAYELHVEQIPNRMICDNMVAAAISRLGVDAAIHHRDHPCAAPRMQPQLTSISPPPPRNRLPDCESLAANGDTANKIGTLQLALACQHYGIPFIVAAPTTSIDLNTASGEDIVIEERPAGELLHITGLEVGEGASPGRMTTIRVSPASTGCWNPSFDVTPASLIAAIVTERGTFVREPGADTFNLRAALQ
ncbi:hypothetical protein H696_02480 [Fonticula alba]|uniref:Methylthioribose-1-phosphate isomerase n=1 Tax=Fonticula alba TaxID=691883 RepID=A0A058ZAX1_FONAL|nr:hypothetical protein H696_02480 [Fonticula alba]KCV71544.1 hypothetical protein H696_02480 [Fonticula alba]|eukprot:XP_009494667.1 hypothetical protein H696_02480 [Fonticula alba]